MNEKYIEKIPKWIFEGNNSNCNTCLSNDIDSLASCSILKQIKDWHIGYFYDFSTLFKTENALDKAVAVDIDIAKGKCLSNHVTNIYNENAVNFNVMEAITQQNYLMKFCGSTLIMLYWLFDIPLPSTEIGKMILLSIDTTFKGYFIELETIKQANFHYLVEIMQFDELYNLQAKHVKQNFFNLIDDYKLYEKIKCVNGKLQTKLDLNTISKLLELDLKLPEDNFYEKYKFENKYKSIFNNNLDLSEDVFSLALTSRDALCYSVRIQ